MDRGFDWDNVKAAANLRKHGVSFEEAESVLDSLLSITVDDIVHSEHEIRERTVGLSNKGRVLIVITAKRSGVVRIISARKGSRVEVEEYEEEIKKHFGG